MRKGEFWLNLRFELEVSEEFFRHSKPGEGHFDPTTRRAIRDVMASLEDAGARVVSVGGASQGFGDGFNSPSPVSTKPVVRPYAKPEAA